MTLLSLTIGLLSLFLSVGTAEAETLGQEAIRDAGDKWVPCERLYGPPGQECQVNGKMIKTRQPPKRVDLPYNDFLQILAKTEHREKLLNQCKAGEVVRIQLDKEKDRKIELLEGQIKNLIETAETHERLGQTQEQIIEAVQKQLAKLTDELNIEKRLSRYKSEAFVLGVVGVILMMVVN